jgi:AI-2 transport protein TqsA
MQGVLTDGQGGEGGGALGFVSGVAGSIVRSLGTTLSLMTLIFFFALIMLTEVPTWRSKLSAATGGDMEGDWRETIVSAGQRFRWYLVVRTVVGVATAVLYGAWLLVFGVEFVGVWVVLTFLLSYIPTLGSLISGLLPFLFALATKDLGTAIGVGAGLLVIEQVMGNFVDPKMQGRELSLSPLVILFSLLLWGYLWGIAGTLIAVPITALIVVAFAHVEPLRPIALMLSGSDSYEALDRDVRPGG